MKIELLDEVLENDDLDLNKEYEVVGTINEQDDLYYIVINEKGREVSVHELIACKTKA